MAMGQNVEKWRTSGYWAINDMQTGSIIEPVVGGEPRMEDDTNVGTSIAGIPFRGQKSLYEIMEEEDRPLHNTESCAIKGCRGEYLISPTHVCQDKDDIGILTLSGTLLLDHPVTIRYRSVWGNKPNPLTFKGSYARCKAIHMVPSDYPPYDDIPSQYFDTPAEAWEKCLEGDDGENEYRVTDFETNYITTSKTCNSIVVDEERRWSASYVRINEDCEEEELTRLIGPATEEEPDWDTVKNTGAVIRCQASGAVIHTAGEPPEDNDHPDIITEIMQCGAAISTAMTYEEHYNQAVAEEGIIDPRVFSCGAISYIEGGLLGGTEAIILFDDDLPEIDAADDLAYSTESRFTILPYYGDDVNVEEEE